jgi:hypothetical protein
MFCAATRVKTSGATSVKKKTKIWVGIGAFVLAGGGGLTSPEPAAAVAAVEAGAPASASPRAALLSSAANIVLAQAAGGERGEGGEGGEGGEAGINVAATENDPVEYNIALQVIAAHYYAGLAAYEGKETEAGAQMFAHGLSEVFIPMEEVFGRRGVKGLREAMEAAVDAGASKKPTVAVRKLVQDVLKALAAAEKAAPKSEQSALAVKIKVVADMLNRAASQYNASLGDKTLEPYLDGLGFATAARKEADKVLPQLRKSDKKKAAAFKTALDMAAKAYPGIKRPAKPPVRAGDFLAASSAAQLAVSR